VREIADNYAHNGPDETESYQHLFKGSSKFAKEH
jgi:hypothetical protein